MTHQYTIYVRALRAFQYWMNKNLIANEHKGHWRNESNHYLIRRLREEVEELATLVSNTPYPSEQICEEAADVANFAMMLSDNAERAVMRQEEIKRKVDKRLSEEAAWGEGES